MSPFKNKHMTVAMIVTPILAILAWFVADRMVGEAPHAAVEGNSYPLVELPNCRYDSGNCSLKNEDFRLDINFTAATAGSVLLLLESEFPLEGVKLAVASAGSTSTTPREMQAVDGSAVNWSIEIEMPDPETDRLQLVASAQQTLYYGEVSTNFMLPK